VNIDHRPNRWYASAQIREFEERKISLKTSLDQQMDRRDWRREAVMCFD
jgi:hypothetical protein